MTGTVTGAVAGLVAITPAAGFVGPIAAIGIGFGVGLLSFYAILLKTRLGFDDSLDVWAVHGVGGIWGALATGIFATTAINPGGANGLLFGNPAQLGIQAIGVAASAGYAFAVTAILLIVLNRVMGLRVTSEDEDVGLDETQHGEKGYGLFG